MGEWAVWFVLGCRRWVEQTVQGVVGYHSLQQSPDHTTSHWEVRKKRWDLEGDEHRDNRERLESCSV